MQINSGQMENKSGGRSTRNSNKSLDEAEETKEKPKGILRAGFEAAISTGLL